MPGKVLNDAHPYGTLTVAEVFAKSSNIGCAKIAERMTADDVYTWITKFGFGSKTDIGIMFEPSGFVPKPAKWSGPTRSNLAIGHGVSVTAAANRVRICGNCKWRLVDAAKACDSLVRISDR